MKVTFNTLLAATLLLGCSAYGQGRKTLPKPGAEALQKATEHRISARDIGVEVLTGPAATVNLPFISREYNWDANNQAWAADSQRVGYRYNSNGQQLWRAAYGYSRNDSTSRIVRAYDAAGRDTSLIFYLRRSGAWVPFFKDRSVYDAQGNLTYSGLLDWDAPSQTFVQSSAYTYTYQYDPQNRITEEIYAATDFFSGVMQLQTKRVYGYPASTGGYQTLVSFAADSLGNWTPEDSIAEISWYNYDLSLPSYFKRFEYDAGAYFPTDEGTWSYTTNDEYTTVYRLFDGTGWVNANREVQGFLGDTVVYVYQDWNGTDWTNSYRTLDLTDMQGNSVLSLDQSWGSASWFSNSGTLNENVYDASQALSMVTRSTWDTAARAFKRVSRSRYSDFGTFTEAKPTLETSLAVYPSPAKSSLVVKIANQTVTTLEAVDATGRRHPLTVANGQANVSGLSGGLYHILATDALGRQYRGRFVKE